MRPLELRLRNFRSYFGPEAVFDLHHRSLVGVVGPIGSGKSSLLDAVAFALYGRTPAGGTATRALIHQRAEAGAVQLRFAVEGEVWEVVRSLRRQGQSQHALYRYAGDSDGDERVEKITMEGAVNDRIRELLGLDFDAFCRSVMLAQGRFAEFLTAGAATRDGVLKGVFGHDRIDQMREVARTHATGLATELARIEGQLVQIDGLKGRLAGKVAHLEEVDARLETLIKAEPRMTDLDVGIGEATTRAEQARSRLAALSPLGVQLPDPAAVAALVDEASAAHAGRIGLAAAMDQADAARGAAEAALVELERSGERDLIDRASRRHAELALQIRAMETAAGELDTLVGQIDTEHRRRAETAAGLEAYRAGGRAADEAIAAAVAALDRARTARHDASHRNMAAELRGGLAAGDACPVCLRAIDELPAAEPPTDLETAEAALTAAEAERRAAERSCKDAAARTARLETELEALDRRRTELGGARSTREGDLESGRSEVARTKHELVELLGEGDPEAVIAQRRSRITGLEKAADEARHRFETARTEHGEAIAAEQGVARRSSEMHRALDRVAIGLGIEVGGDGSDDTNELARAVERVRKAWSDETASVDATAEQAETDLTSSRTLHGELMKQLGVEGDFAVALATARARSEHLADDISDDRAQIEAAAGLAEQRTQLATARKRFDRIVHDLTDARFVRFLLDDERARLAALGSEHFMRLTSGRYRFTEDGDFSIVDLTTADAVRKASSLSGGETFLASLALALALAEMVTRTGGRLDAFFLDEGFGSLDPEHLDLAMDGIRALVADGGSRLVVVVSHVPELKESIEDLIQLDRHPLTGDTRVIRA
ncbi:hypothetical protein BH24ACT7_BH24ACT7_11450 [soil metagenome]